MDTTDDSRKDHEGRIASLEAKIESAFRHIDTLTAKFERMSELLVKLRLEWERDRVKLAFLVGGVVFLLTVVGQIVAGLVLMRMTGGLG